MIGDHSVLAVICARGGSKGLPRKNVLDLGGKPLIAWSIEAAVRSRILDRTVISTDDEEIAAASRAAGGEVPFLRPAELATDDIPVAEAVIHMVENLESRYDIVVLLQATSPFRIADDIDATVRQLVEHGGDCCVTFSELPKPASYIVEIDAEGRVCPMDGGGLLKRRQDSKPKYWPNALVYAVWTDYLIRERKFYGEHTMAHVTPYERAIDIDTLYDLEVARGLVLRPGFRLG
ncbi:cytidylyltransferase domain-containing protein [Minwuia thermotolerans]|uniref:Acylneuraminate cytidylyltransferase n=1 Tax=Minwuia thermotolerans TaxID=2056226 RepID=A0A2M9G660_9PROT|nr:acylneuraminate cytidylyltransferase family protein [Minwuia thermotolerans]PJK31205.1 acylneuraminate cytidylyltransferase [Minwuia thermotolerans]